MAADLTQLEITRATAMEALGSVAYPGLTRDLVSFGMVEHVAVCDRRVSVRLAIRSPRATVRERLEVQVADALHAAGATDVHVEIVEPTRKSIATERRSADPWDEQGRLSNATHVIAIGAGKGGVGKSTVAVNLALTLAQQGVRTALLDADIYGPSLPILLGIEDGADRVHLSPEKHILPLEAYGLPIISFGFFVGEQSPAIWRGPMVSKAVRQFVRGVAWPAVDLLIVDLPPGTGDVPLSLAQSVVLSGAIVVTQPARVAVAEAHKACAMFRSLDVPLLGIVENMCGAFGRGTGEQVAAELGTPFLGAIPFDERIVADGDAGIPTMTRPSDATRSAFERIAEGMARELGWRRDDGGVPT